LASQPIHSFSASAKLDFRRWPEERLIARVRELSNDSLEGAIERGYILKRLNLAWHDYESKKVGISHHTAYRLIALVDHPRMQRDDWERPCQWTVCYELLQVTDKCFEAMLKAGFISYHTVRHQVRDFVRAWKRRAQITVAEAAPVNTRVSFTSTADDFHIHSGSALEVLAKLPEGSIQTCVTSPPYFGLRDYQADGQIGLEKTPEEYVEKLVEVFRAVRRVLRPDGTLWLNIGDSYYTAGDTKTDSTRAASPKMGGRLIIPKRRKAIPGLKKKDLIGIPWMLAFALRKDGWYLRSEIIWSNPACMPESVTDRPTKAHEQIFLLTKSEKYFYDAEAISEPCQQPGRTRRIITQERADGGSRKDGDNVVTDGETRNRRSVWSINPGSGFDGAHFATFPPELPKTCILAGTSKHGCCPLCYAVFDQKGPHCKHKKPAIPCTVLDPFSGSGTTGVVAIAMDRVYQGIEINPEYVAMSQQRLKEHLAKPENIFSQASLDDSFE
jgi:DNA modification methylase